MRLSKLLSSSNHSVFNIIRVPVRITVYVWCARDEKCLRNTAVEDPGGVLVEISTVIRTFLRLK
jgi:hypothetical protein